MTITKRLKSKGFTLVELLVVIAIIAALAAMATPVIMKQQKKAAMTTAINNAKQIFYLLNDFDQDFGSFPSLAILEDHPDLSPYGSTQGGNLSAQGLTSNALLGQLIAGGYTNSEEIFFAKGGSSTNKKPDNVITPGKILEKGECGFAYVLDADGNALSTSNNTACTIIAAPMDKGTKFKRDPYDGKAIALRIDGSVQTLRIKKAVGGANSPSGEAFGTGGKTLFQAGEDTVWGSIVPKPVLPE